MDAGFQSGSHLGMGALDATRMNISGRKEAAQLAELQSGGSDQKADEAAEKFEALLGGMLAKELRKGLPEGFFGEGPGSEQFSSWLDQFVGEAIAERGAFGFKTMVSAFVRDFERIAREEAMSAEVGTQLEVNG